MSVLGSEGAGIPPEVLSSVHEKIFVSPYGNIVSDNYVDSLNVSVAAGIIINKLCQHLRNKNN